MVLPALSLKFPVRTLLFAVVLAAVAAGGWFWGGGLVCVAHQDGHIIHTGQLMGESTVGQVFFCDRAGLSRIETRMGTYGSWSNSEFELGLVEVGSAAAIPRARFGPKDGAMIKLREGWSALTLLQAARPGADGLEILVSNPGRTSQGELVAAVVPWDIGASDLGSPFVFRRPLAGIGPHERVRFALSRGVPSPPRPLMVEVRLEGALPGTFAGLHWRPFPAVHLPQVLEKPNRFWRAFRMDSLGLNRELGGEVYQGQLVMNLTYPPQVPLKPLKRGRIEKSLWVSDNTFHPVSFEPIADSENKTYHFFYRAPGASLSNALTLWAHRRSGPASHLTENGTAVDGALSFRAYASVSKGEAMNRFTAKLNEGKTGAWPSGWMIITAVALQVLILAGICSYLIGLGKSAGDGTF